MLRKKYCPGPVPAEVVTPIGIGSPNDWLGFKALPGFVFALLPVLVTETTTLGYGPASGILTEGLGAFGHKKTARRRLWQVDELRYQIVSGLSIGRLQFRV
jgi:hypothetical protein